MGGVLDRLMGDGAAARKPTPKKPKSHTPQHHADVASTMQLLKTVVHKANRLRSSRAKGLLDHLMGGGSSYHGQKSHKTKKAKAAPAKKEKKKTESWKESFKHHGKNPFDEDDDAKPAKQTKDEDMETTEDDLLLHDTDLSFGHQKKKRDDNPFVLKNKSDSKKKDTNAVKHLINIGMGGDEDDEDEVCI